MARGHIKNLSHKKRPYSSPKTLDVPLKNLTKFQREIVTCGLKSKGLNQENLPQTIKNLGLILDSQKGSQKEYISDEIKKFLRLRALSDHRIELMTPVITNSPQWSLTAPYIRTMAKALNSKVLSDKQLETVSPIMEKMAKDGHDPYFPLHMTVFALESKALKQSELPQFLGEVQKGFDATKDMDTCRHHLFTVINPGIKSGVIKPKRIRKAIKDVSLTLNAIEKVEPVNMGAFFAGNIQEALESGVFTEKSFGHYLNNSLHTARAKHTPFAFNDISVAALRAGAINEGNSEKVMRDVRLATEALNKHSTKKHSEAKPEGSEGAEKKRERERFVQSVRHGLELKRIDKTNISKYLGLHRYTTRDYSHAEVLRHGYLVAERVPKNKVPDYQAILLRGGSFPTPKLVESLHDLHNQNILKRKKELAKGKNTGKPRL